MLPFSLNVVSLGLQLAVLAGIVHMLRWHYPWVRWRRAWVAMLLATGLMVLRRVYDLPLPISPLGVLLPMGVSLCMLYWLVHLKRLYAAPLTPVTPTTAAHVTVDATLTIRAWDAQATALFGWTGDEVRGSTLKHTLMPPPIWDVYTRGIPSLEVCPTRTEFAWTHTVPGITLCCKDGRCIPVEVTLARVLDADGTCVLQATLRRLIVQ